MRSSNHVIMSVGLTAPCLLLSSALERPEGVSQQDYTAMEEFQQRTNAVSLEKVKAYYRRLRYAASQPPPLQVVYSLKLWMDFTLKGEFTL